MNQPNSTENVLMEMEFKKIQEKTLRILQLLLKVRRDQERSNFN